VPSPIDDQYALSHPCRDKGSFLSYQSPYPGYLFPLSSLSHRDRFLLMVATLRITRTSPFP